MRRRELARNPPAAGCSICSLLTAFLALAMVSFFRKSVWLKYVTFVASVGYMGFMKSSLVSISDVFRLTDLSVPPFKYTLDWYAFTAVRGRVDRPVGAGVLRPHLRVRLADAVDGPDHPEEVAIRNSRSHREARQPDQVRRAGGRAGLLPRDEGRRRYRSATSSRSGCSACSAARRCGSASACCWSRRSSSAICTAGSSARSARRSASCRNLTVFRIKRWSECNTLQDLREDLRMGRDSRTADRQERVRALRRLRAALHGPEEMPALAHPVQTQGQHGGSSQRRSGLRIAELQIRLRITLVTPARNPQSDPASNRNPRILTPRNAVSRRIRRRREQHEAILQP